MSFKDLHLHPLILKAVDEAGYTSPTPIQQQAIPAILAGSDVLASAQTGTGKTAAFILPALNKLMQPARTKSRGPRVLVLTPTRELAMQITAATSTYGKYVPQVATVCILGGMPYHVQNRQLSRPVEILVATPGRLLDHLADGKIDFSRFELLVLDEADRMLDMGFIDDVERIVQATPKTRQTLLFSATLKSDILGLASHMLINPIEIHIEPENHQATQDNIEQRLMYVDDLTHKNRLLAHLLEDASINQTIVFTATKRNAEVLVDNLRDKGHYVAALHGDMSQRARNRTLDRLRHGSIKVLIATDVAARGLDVPGISHVINFDLPQSSEGYVHRIGRTGRAGASGIAVSFASGKDILALEKIERELGQPITPHVIPGFEPKYKPVASSRGTSNYARRRPFYRGRDQGQGQGQGRRRFSSPTRRGNEQRSPRQSREF